MGKCLLHKETDASKVDPEVRAFVGKTCVSNFIGCSPISVLRKLTDKEKQIEDRQKDRQKSFYKRTEVVMGKCLLHKETDASKVDPEVLAFVGKN
jgi:hypothetical protein